MRAHVGGSNFGTLNNGEPYSRSNFTQFLTSGDGPFQPLSLYSKQLKDTLRDRLNHYQAERIEIGRWTERTEIFRRRYMGRPGAADNLIVRTDGRSQQLQPSNRYDPHPEDINVDGLTVWQQAKSRSSEINIKYGLFVLGTHLFYQPRSLQRCSFSVFASIRKGTDFLSFSSAIHFRLQRPHILVLQESSDAPTESLVRALFTPNDLSAHRCPNLRSKFLSPFLLHTFVGAQSHHARLAWVHVGCHLDRA